MQQETAYRSRKHSSSGHIFETLLNALPSVTKRLHRARIELLWVLVGQVFAFVGGFAGIKILTNIMGPGNYGQLALGMTISGMLNLFVFGPIGQVVSRFFSRYRERHSLSHYFFLLRKIHVYAVLSLIVFVGLVCVFVYGFWGREWALLVGAALLFGIVSGVNNSFLALQSAARQRKVVALHQGADACLRPALAVLLLLIFRNSGYFALIGYLVGTLLVTGSQWFFAMRDADIGSHFWAVPVNRCDMAEQFKELAAYSLPFVAFAGFGVASMYTDRWILQFVVGLRDVGIYAAISQVATAPVALIAGVMTQLMVPVIFDKAGDLTHPDQFRASSVTLNATSVVFGIVMLIVCAAVILLAHPILELLTSAEFADNSPLLGVLIVGASVFNLAQILCIKGNYINQPQVYFWPKAVQAIFSVVFGYIGVKKFGIMGVGYAICGASLLYLGLVVKANKRLESRSVLIGGMRSSVVEF